MAKRKRQFPTLEEIRAKAERGIVDDALATEAAPDYDDWEILGTPAPEEPAADERDAVERRAST